MAISFILLGYPLLWGITGNNFSVFYENSGGLHVNFLNLYRRIPNIKLYNAIAAILMAAALVLPATAQSAGSRDNPVPIGTYVDMDDNWEITVLSVFPNTTEEMVYGSTSSRFERDPGEEIFLAKIQAKYIGPGSHYFRRDHI
ncbi:Uncharacterised protein [uncultured archaeon]|nr:Uncharacterised protein [uncultured archaeon]